MPWPKGRPAHNKGKTLIEVYGQERAEAIRSSMRRSAIGFSSWGRMTQEQREQVRRDQSARIQERYAAGWLPKAGRCPRLSYTSPVAGVVSLDGTWELRVAEYFDRQGFRWQRNTKRFSYRHPSGRVAHYTPDFYVEDFGSYVEVKGCTTVYDLAKWSQFQYPLIVWKKTDLKCLGIL